MGKSKQMFIDQGDDGVVHETVPKTFGATVFKTVIGNKFVEMINITEILINESGEIHKVDKMIPQSCSFEWAMDQRVSPWGIDSISIRPIRLIVDAIVEITIDDEKCGMDVRFEHLNETALITLNLDNYNPLVNGIVPTGVVIKHKTDEIPQIQIQF
jgi:hypothetical protein